MQSVSLFELALGIVWSLLTISISSMEDMEDMRDKEEEDDNYTKKKEKKKKFYADCAGGLHF